MDLELAFQELRSIAKWPLPVEVFRELESTQSYLRQSKEEEPRLVVAARQSGGQGRMGRAWSSPPGGLWFSLIYPTARVEGLSLVVGLAVARLVRRYGLEPWMRWPNDIMVGEKKLSGILVDCRWRGPGQGTAVIGIGLNVEVEPPAELKDIAVCLTDLGLARPHLGQLLLEFLQEWMALGESFGRGGLAELLGEVRGLIGQGQPIVVHEQGQKYSDRIAGVEGDGSLRLASGRQLYSVERLEMLGRGAVDLDL